MTTPWWHPEQLAARRDNLRARGRIIAHIRSYFVKRGFAEVETPALQVSPGMEPHLRAFSTALEYPQGGSRPLDLHTSPEFAMKKLLVAGEPKIFQFARVYRNGERSDTHHPEFTMLEWYRAGGATIDLIEDCGAILGEAATVAPNNLLRWQGKTCDPSQRWQVITVADAFRQYAEIDLLATAPDPLAPDFALLAKAAIQAGIEPHDGDDWEDLFFRIFLERIEPNLGSPAPSVVTEYPVSMAALARPCAHDARVADRFELYVAGLELANAFGELTDAAEQRRRFEADQARKLALYGTRCEIDEDFLAALEFGMPDSAGIALGLDRLAMLATGAERIDDVLWAPVAE
jgi:lysyl-tRNA synthetase class 2